MLARLIHNQASFSGPEYHYIVCLFIYIYVHACLPQCICMRQAHVVSEEARRGIQISLILQLQM